MTRTPHRHIIHQQHIEVGVAAGQGAFALQERVRNIYYEKIIPRLDRLFSGIAGEDTIIRIDRLRLDVGAVQMEKLEEELTEQVVRAVEESLRGRLRFDVSDSGGMEVITVRRSAAETLLYFLAEGRLPWWTVADDLATLEELILHDDEQKGNVPERLRRLIEEKEEAVQRLVFQFSDAFLSRVLTICYPGRESLYEDVPAFRGSERVRAWRAAFRAAADRGGGGTVRETVTGVGEGVDDPYPSGDDGPGSGNDEGIDPGGGINDDGVGFTVSDEVTAAGDAGSIVPEESVLKEAPALLPGEKAPEPGEVKGGSDARRPEGIEDSSAGADAGLSRREEPAGEAGATMDRPQWGSRENDRQREHASQRERENGGKRDRSSRRGGDDKDAIYLGLAGLVLLHPFLIAFFDELHFLDGKIFRDEDARQQAVHLLGYLATGEEDIEEPVLLFPKILCGMPPAQPVQRMDVLTSVQRAEADHMLEVVIGYWKALKSTSTAGLRSSFLQRDGKLSPREGGWQLDVEKKTWDVLLGSLPWGYSIVKLPWMKEMVFVNWG